jgi:hypothetical protein
MPISSLQMGLAAVAILLPVLGVAKWLMRKRVLAG